MSPKEDERQVPDASSIHKPIVIIGAGASGLQCATELIKKGCNQQDIIILEARDRPGGRIYSTVECAENNREFVMDHGAAWVHGTGSRITTNENRVKSILKNPAMELLQQAHNNFENEPSWLDPVLEGNPWMEPELLIQDDKIQIYANGTEVSKANIIEACEEANAIQNKVSQHAQIVLESGQASRLANDSIKDSITSRDAQPYDSSTNFFFHLLEYWYGRDIGSISIGEMLDADEEDSHFGDFPGPHCVVPTRGMSAVLEPLLDLVERCIRFSDPVVEISRSDDGVLITTANGLQVSADFCVVTLSVGCLQAGISHNLFAPPLDDEKAESIQRMGMGKYKKVMLFFDEIFWSADVPFIGLVVDGDDDLPFQRLLVDNLWAKRQIPCLEIVLTGEAGKWAFNQTDSFIETTCVEILRKAMGIPNTIYPRRVHVTRWEEDPFSCGAYASLPIGATETDVEAYVQPTWKNRLYFAGEAAVLEYEGSVPAALMSGRRVATQLYELLK